MERQWDACRWLTVGSECVRVGKLCYMWSSHFHTFTSAQNINAHTHTLTRFQNGLINGGAYCNNVNGLDTQALRTTWELFFSPFQHTPTHTNTCTHTHTHTHQWLQYDRPADRLGHHLPLPAQFTFREQGSGWHALASAVVPESEDFQMYHFPPSWVKYQQGTPSLGYSLVSWNFQNSRLLTNILGYSNQVQCDPKQYQTSKTLWWAKLVIETRGTE